MQANSIMEDKAMQKETPHFVAIRNNNREPERYPDQALIAALARCDITGRIKEPGLVCAEPVFPYQRRSIEREIRHIGYIVAFSEIERAEPKSAVA